MDITVKRALKLGWDEVVSIVTLELKKVLGIQLQCKISLTEDEYWDVEFIDYRMPLPKLCQVLQAVEAAPDDWETVLPDEGAVDVRDLGMCAAEKLIGKHLHLSWEHRIIDEDGLWLVGLASCQQSLDKGPVAEFTLPISTKLLDAVGEMAAYFRDNIVAERCSENLSHTQS